jgi:OmcA/MtrC family decaheme c-type cytochrome
MTPHVTDQADDSSCVICHAPSGGLAGVADRHLTPLTDPASPRVALAILGVTQTAPGEQPVIDFSVKVNGEPRDILATPLSTLRFTVAGPTTDYTTYWQGTIQGSGMTGTLTALDAAAGTFRYVAAAAAGIPPTATGSYVVALEGYLRVGTVNYPAPAPVAFVAVTDPAPVPRREVVDDDRCNACHGEYGPQGHSTRRGVQYCLFCHNPNLANETRVARWEGSTALAQSEDFKVLIHKIHRGTRLTQPYVIGGLPAPSPVNPAGNPIDYRLVRSPADPRACTACHRPGTYELPLPTSRLPSREVLLACDEDAAYDTNSYCETAYWSAAETSSTAPTTAACTSCHDAPHTLAHAQVMTASNGVESCATCHATGASSGIDVAHALDP